MRETMSKLGRKVEDLEDVKFVMDVLHQVRDSIASLQMPGAPPLRKVAVGQVQALFVGT